MLFKKVKINSYKSFFESDEIEFTEGINLVVGKNNSGKTSLLEILSGEIKANFHKNENLKPRKNSKTKEVKSTAEIHYYASLDEVRMYGEDNGYNKALAIAQISYFVCDNETERGEHGHGWTYYHIDDLHDPDEGYYVSADFKEVESYFYDLLKNGMSMQVDISQKRLLLDNKEIRTSSNIEVVGFSFDEEDKFNLNKFSNEKTSAEYEVTNILFKHFFENIIFKFDIHRTVKSKCPTALNNQLNTNCNNLPGVLDRLQVDKDIFEEYVNRVKSVFPEVKNVSIQKDGKNAEILVWMKNSIARRSDLAIPLEDCGTGIGQVMAILYLAVASEDQKVIIIDEPNSFLHPSANRRLIEVLKKYPQHQYIIATHSPETISRSNAENILFLSLDENGQTQVKKINKKDKREMLSALESVGSNLSDVYGYESILWVEGPTEEKCFPMIVEKLLNSSTVKTPIIKVHDTGSLERKHIDTTLHIYKKLIDGNTLLPYAQAFIFDKDFKSEEEINLIKRKGENICGQGKFIFLDRKEYENYLLYNGAIIAVLQNLKDEYEIDTTLPTNVELEEFIESIKSNTNFWSNETPTKEQLKNWKRDIHSSVLLKEIFKKYLLGLVPFGKVAHSSMLTEWLIENKPEELEELRILLEPFYLKE